MTKPADNTPIVLVEPLCRGSRLQVLVNMVTALQGHRPVVVLTRADYATDHFRELVLAPHLACTVITAPTDFGGAWTKLLAWAELRLFLDRLAAWETDCRQPYDLLWMAVDDYLGAFVRGGLGYRRRLQPRRVFAAKWRVEYLLPGHNRPRELALRWLTRTGLRAWHANLLAFDERLADAATRPPGTGVLPDLWFGEFSDRHRPAARQQHGFTATDYVALTVGRQDERKGLPVVLAAFESLLTRWPDLVLFVVGPVADRLRPGLDRLRRAHGATRVRQHPEFVPEADMPRVFAAADVVLLPYARQFTASSGVLPRAAASGVPVVASDHGLVGHRVRRWQLGETFPAGSAPALGAALERLRQQQATFDPAGLRAYAAASSLAAFQAAARRAILGDS